MKGIVNILIISIITFILINCNSTVNGDEPITKTQIILGKPFYYKSDTQNRHLKLGLKIIEKKDFSDEYSPFGKPSGEENVPSSSINEEIIFVNLLNKARKEKGMSELKINQDLCRAARYHSFDMGKQNYFEHASYDRNESTGHLEKVCGTFTRINKFAKSYGENIAAGNGTGERTFEQWYNSPGHYGNMFNPKFKTIGVGYVKIAGSKYNHYWTTDFGY